MRCDGTWQPEGFPTGARTSKRLAALPSDTPSRTRRPASSTRRTRQGSSGGMYVDEYQDCTEAQHGLVRALAEVLPTRLLGDPMQGIFAFGDDRLVDLDEFDDDFEQLDDLTVPWRWSQTNPQLGEWLYDARTRLITGRDPDFASGPVSVRS